MGKILLIIPCYNEEKRLNFQSFTQGLELCKQKDIQITYLFANDGSTDQSKKLIDAYCSEHNHLAFHSSQNLGKGNIIQSAYMDAKEKLNLNDFKWIGHWDADLATPIAAVTQMDLYLTNFYQDSSIKAIYGCRVSRLGSLIQRRPHRHYLGRIFVTIVSLLLKVKAYDSQCGAKLFSPEAAERAFARPFISKWMFDVEILLRLNEKEIIEFPLLEWKDIPGGKVNVLRDSFRVLWDLCRIKLTK